MVICDNLGWTWNISKCLLVHNTKLLDSQQLVREYLHGAAGFFQQKQSFCNFRRLYLNLCHCYTVFKLLSTDVKFMLSKCREEEAEGMQEQLPPKSGIL